MAQATVSELLDLQQLRIEEDSSFAYVDITKFPLPQCLQPNLLPTYPLKDDQISKLPPSDFKPKHTAIIQSTSRYHATSHPIFMEALIEFAHWKKIANGSSFDGPNYSSKHALAVHCYGSRNSHASSIPSTSSSIPTSTTSSKQSRSKTLLVSHQYPEWSEYFFSSRAARLFQKIVDFTPPGYSHHVSVPKQYTSRPVNSANDVKLSFAESITPDLSLDVLHQYPSIPFLDYKMDVVYGYFISNFFLPTVISEFTIDDTASKFDQLYAYVLLHYHHYLLNVPVLGIVFKPSFFEVYGFFIDRHEKKLAHTSLFFGSSTSKAEVFALHQVVKSFSIRVLSDLIYNQEEFSPKSNSVTLRLGDRMYKVIENRKYSTERSFEAWKCCCQFYPDFDLELIEVSSGPYSFGSYISYKFHDGSHSPSSMLHIYNLIAELSVLHKHKLVHGDIRLSNIVFKDNGDVRLIDFDLSGENDDQTYPSGFNHVINDGYRHPIAQSPNSLKYVHDVYAVVELLIQMIKPTFADKTDNEKWDCMLSSLALCKSFGNLDLDQVLKPILSIKKCEFAVLPRETESTDSPLKIKK